MAFNSSSYFVGVGTAFAAIAIGFAGGAMITTSTVQPPNRLERVAAGTAAPPSSAPSNATPASTTLPGQASQQASVTTPAPQPQAAATAPAPAVASSAPAADSAPVQQPQPATPAVKTDAANIQPAPPSITKAEDAAPARNERANVRAAEPNRDAARSAEMNREPSRKRGDERKFVERKRRQDLERQNLDEATNVVRQMPRDRAVEVVDEDDAPRIANGPPRRFGLFRDDEDSPRAAPPPRFGLFGN
jgi:hypothetical protein